MVPLDAARFELAGDLLVRAFHDYPDKVRPLFPEGRRRERSLSWYVRFALSYCFKYGEVSIAEPPDGVALFLKTGYTFTYPQIIAAGLLLGPLQMGFAAFWRLMKNENHLGEIRERFAQPGAWYVWFVGVDPAAQGRGVGGRLMGNIVEAADEAGASCYCETHLGGVVDYCRSQGFEVVCEGRVPSSGLPFWAMSRRPRKPGISVPVAISSPPTIIAPVKREAGAATPDLPARPGRQRS